MLQEVDAQITALLEDVGLLSNQLEVNTEEELCFFPVTGTRKLFSLAIPGLSGNS